LYFILATSLITNIALFHSLKNIQSSIDLGISTIKKASFTAKDEESVEKDMDINDATDLWKYSDTLYWQIHSSSSNGGKPFVNSKYGYTVDIPADMYLLIHPLSGLEWLTFIHTESSIYGDQTDLSVDKYNESTFSEYVSNYPNRIQADGPCVSIGGGKVTKEEDLVINNMNVKRVYVSQRVESCNAETKTEEIGPIYIFDASKFNNGAKVALVLSRNKSTASLIDADLKSLEKIANSVQPIE